MRNGSPPGRGPRGDNRARPGRPPAASYGGRRNDGRAERRGDAYAPYQPYQQMSGGRVPVPPGASAGWMPAVGAGARQLDWESMDAQGGQRHRLGIAIFHDGNPGHLWRGEVASVLGEVTLSVGVVMWLAALTQSPLIVAAAAVALGLPYLLTGPLTARLENSDDPAGSLKWISRLRVVFSLGLIAMHFRTSVPMLLALLFAVSLCGRLREAWRVAALRVCLLPGEPEHVANDVQIGATVAAVLGPLLATLLYILIGERILLVSIGAALLFLISANSESFLDPLAEERRAYLLADPETVNMDGEPLNAADEDVGDAGETEEERERRLPAWYQQGPTSMWEALGELRAGLGLAGTSNPATAAMLAITVLALTGGALAVLEVFYVVGAMRLPSFYLGPLVAVECAGLAVGALLAGVSSPRGAWRIKLVAGVMGSGAGIMLLASLPVMPTALIVVAMLGVANAFALAGARHGLALGFDQVERRAIAAAERWVAALAGLAGAVFVFFLDTSRLAPGLSHRTLQLLQRLPSWRVEQLLFLLGMGLIGGVVVFGVLLVFARQQRAKRKKAGAGVKGKGQAKGKAGGKADAGGSSGRRPNRLARADFAGDEEEAESAYLPAAGDDDERWDGGYESAEYASAEYGRYDETGYGPATGYGPPTGYGPATGYDEAAGYDDEEGGYDPRAAGRRPRQQGPNRQLRW